MTVRIYRSTDASAPTLTGSAGALLTVLDAVLVNGYGSQTAAGWTIAYTGTNKRQYAMAAGGTSCQLYIDDTGPGAGGAKEARFNGFKTGTALGTGTGQFPTTAQMTAPSGALVIRKSTTADATARAWTIIADGHTIYGFFETGDTTTFGAMAYPWMFGDFFSYSSTDTNNCAIIGRRAENVQFYSSSGFSSSVNWPSQTNTVEVFSQLQSLSTTYLSDTLLGHYACGSFTGAGGSIAIGKDSDIATMGYGSASWSTPQVGRLSGGPGSISTETLWINEFNYPNSPDGGLYVAPIYIHHNGIRRGYLKGLWNPLQHLPLNHGDTYSGTGNLSGKSMIAMNILGATNGTPNTAANCGPAQVHVEYSDTWS